jgi:hypothetical protein
LQEVATDLQTDLRLNSFDGLFDLRYFVRGTKRGALTLDSLFQPKNFTVAIDGRIEVSPMTKDLGALHVLMDDLGPGPTLQGKSDDISSNVEVVGVALERILIGFDRFVKPPLIG